MSFLTPWLLTLGIAAAVPLLIHLLRRRLGTRLDFPAVRYLLRAEQENRRTLRLRNMLLMLLRVATVLLLSIAAAGPIGRMIGAGHSPAAIAIVVDNTMSSGVVVQGRSMLDRFKSAASRIAATTLPTDNVWLVTADGVVAGGTAATVRDAIAALQPTNVDADLPAAVRRAAGLARAARQSARVVVLFTDGQRSTWTSGISTEGIRTVVWSPALTLPVNHAVEFAEARPVRWVPRGEVATRIRSPDSLTYRVTIAGRTLARGTAAPNEEAVIRASPAERGWVSGSIDLAPDELAADDIRYFAVWIGSAPAVHPTSGAGEFVSAALDALKASGRIVAGLTIAVGPADEVAALPALITAPTDPVRLGAANRSLERLSVPWRFGTRRLQHVDAVGRDIGSVPVTERYELLPQTGADADTMAATGQSPWIVAGSRYVIVGSPLTETASALPIRANFISWLAGNLSDRLSGDPGITVAAAPGTFVQRPTGVGQLERPDGSMVAAGDSIKAPANPGVYFFVTAGRRSGAIVVNPPARESQLDRMSAAEMQDKIADASVVDAEESTALETAAFRAASTRSLLPPILIAILLMLFAEAILVTSRRATA